MSIRRYLVLTLVSMLTLISFVAAIQGYKASMVRAEKLFEQQLIDFAHIIQGLHHSFDVSQNQQKLAEVKHALATKKAAKKEHHTALTIDQQTSFSFQVWQGNTLLIKSANSPTKPIINLQKTSNHFSEVNFSGQRWRATYISVNGANANTTSNTSSENNNTALSNNVKSPQEAQSSKKSQQIIMVAQPLIKQFLLAQEVILAAVAPMIIAILLLSVLIYGIITQGLKPLHKLTAALSTKQSNDFSPLTLDVGNSELNSVVRTLNQLFERLNLAFQREKHFAADAAHELKTPLSVLKINVHNLTQSLHDQNVDEPSKIIKPLTLSVERMGHVIDQILHLNRTNPEQINHYNKSVNIKPLLQSVIADLYHNIANKQQTITLQSDDIIIKGDELSLKLMLTNLIVNANKYTPEHGEISVKTTSDKLSDKKITILIEDSGQGIPEEEYNRVFDRFYRVGGDQHDSTVVGCGLGLTIVKHIVDMHRGKIILSKSNVLGGLQVNVIFDKSIIINKQHPQGYIVEDQDVNGNSVKKISFKDSSIKEKSVKEQGERV